MTEKPRPLLDEIEAKDYESKQSELSRSKQLRTTEDALRTLGVHEKSDCGELLRLIVRIAGLGVLTRTNRELASEIGSEHVRSAQRAAEVLAELGLIRRGIVHGSNRRAVGVALQVNWSRIVELSDGNRPIEWATTDPRQIHDMDHDRPTTTATTDPRQVHDMCHDNDHDINTTNGEDTVYNPIPLSLNHYHETNSAAAVVDEKCHADAFEMLLRAYPVHDRAAVRVAVWELAFFGILISARRDQNLIKILRDQIATKSIRSPTNYALVTAEKLCEEEGLNYRSMRCRCPKLPPERIEAPKIETRWQPPAKKDLAKPFSEEDRKLIASFGKPNPLTQNF